MVTWMSSDEDIYIRQNSFSNSTDVLAEVDLLDQVLSHEVCLVESLAQTKCQTNWPLSNEVD
jgi:hypothetical protein